MRTTDLHYRTPKAANVPFTFMPHILDAQKTRTKPFLKEARFQYGSIY